MNSKTANRVPAKARRALRLVADPIGSARAAGLRYMSDEDGTRALRRRRAGRGFVYVDGQGHAIRDPDTLSRIKRLAIPPAWRHVWICPAPDGHLQASGRDARGRKQYRYHPRWRAVRDETKYTRMIAFAAALPAIRRKVADDLDRAGLPREKVLATVVRLLETTLIRVGNEEYARANGSFGLTTLRARHVDVDGSTLTFEFRGKGGRRHRVGVSDRRLARIVRRCQELPGQELFQYVDDDGERRTISSGDVNDYLRTISGEDFTAKDFRTWAGTVLAARALAEIPAFTSATAARRNVARAVERVAESLGNTPAVCRKGYIHPDVIDRYLAGDLLAALAPARRCTGSSHGLRPDETAVVALLQSRLAPAVAA
jgi:DNA topoisomerase-1